MKQRLLCNGRAMLSALLIAAACNGHVAAADPLAAPAGVVEIRNALAQAQDIADSEHREAKIIELPAIGAGLPLDQNGRVELSLRFDRRDEFAESTMLAVHLVSCGAINMDLNGEPLHREFDASADPVNAQACPRPQLISLPTALLYQRGNRLDIRLRGVPLSQASNARRAAYIAPVWIGPQAQLQREQGLAELRLAALPRLTQLGLLTLGGIALLLSHAGRSVRHLRLYGAVALLWSFDFGLAWGIWPFLPAAWFDLLLAALWTPTMALAIDLMLGLSGRRCPWLMRLLVLQGLVIPVGLSLAPLDSKFVWASACASLLLLQGLAVLGICLRDHWQRRRTEFWITLAMLALTAGVWALESGSTTSSLAWPVSLAWAAASPLGWSALLFFVGLRMLAAHNQALIAAQANRAMLQTRIRDITAVVERNFAQLAAMRVEQVTDRERKRIASDLHDDLGAKLLTIVHTCDDERIAILGREALDEMRLSVRGLGGKPMPLEDAVADWRAETVVRLGQTPIDLEWRSAGDPGKQMLSARAYVQTTRVLREAVSNVIKHSQAQNCKCACISSQGEFTMVIEDDGQGMPDSIEQALSSGHGLASMQQRANQMSGHCEISSSPGAGTVVRLKLPL